MMNYWQLVQPLGQTTGMTNEYSSLTKKKRIQIGRIGMSNGQHNDQLCHIIRQYSSWIVKMMKLAV